LVHWRIYLHSENFRNNIARIGEIIIDARTHIIADVGIPICLIKYARISLVKATSPLIVATAEERGNSTMVMHIADTARMPWLRIL